MTETIDTTIADRQRIVAAIGTALAQVLDYDLPPLAEETQLFDQLGLDSTGVLELLMQLEDALGIELDTDDLEMSHFHTVGSLTDFVGAELGG